jgi:tRNA A22 N-methylase
MLQDRCRKVILTDINSGPLKRAAENIKNYAPGYKDKGRVETRLGNGLEVLEPGDVDTIIIAGMGGLLIRDILAARPKVVQELDVLILQPRNNSQELRRYLGTLKDFTIVCEEVVREVDKYSEIITVKRDYGRNIKVPERDLIKKTEMLTGQLDLPEAILEELPAMYLAGEPYDALSEHIDRKLAVAEKIVARIEPSASESERNAALLVEAKERARYIQRFADIYKGEK